MKIFWIVAAVLLGAAPASATSDSVAATRVERLEISFLYNTGRAYEEYTAVATRSFDIATGDVLHVWVHAGIRPCSLDREGGLTCQGELAERKVMRFETRDDLSEALLVFKDATSRVSKIALRADDPYSASGRSIPNECGGATLQRYEYAFNASARGILFGRRVTTAGDADPEAESMTRYVELKACT